MRSTALALAVLFLAAPAARAATFVETTVEETARSSDAVVRGRVVAATSRLAPDGRRIVTDVDVAVEDAWKGAPGPAVRIVVPGGRVGNVAMHVDSAPAFAVGEEVVVFLSRRPDDGWQVAGYALGKYAVEAGEARPGLGEAAFVGRPTPPGERVVGPMSVAELERRVRAAQ